MESKSEIYTYGVKHYWMTEPTAEHTRTCIAEVLPLLRRKYLLTRVLPEGLKIKDVFR
jgi:hypothetical protein